LLVVQEAGGLLGIDGEMESEGAVEVEVDGGMNFELCV
jgi:hypothetical protein